jgi:hypothetical protein
MKSIRCLNRGFIPFAMVASAKQLLTAILFASMLFFAPSLRAGIVYNVPIDSSGYYYNNSYAGSFGYAGNTFSTTSATTLKSISVYLNNLNESLTGNATLRVYATTYFAHPYYPSGYVITGSSLTESSIARSGISSASDTPTDANKYTFNFTGSNAYNLTANTRYAFMLETLNIGMWQNFSNDYAPGENFVEIYYDNSTSPSTIYNNPIPYSSIAGQVEVETTAVPEPGTLILTGSALLAGAIGVYFTRRHKDQALTPATV